MSTSRQSSLRIQLFEKTEVDQNHPQSLSSDHLKVYFFLKPAYPEKNPVSQKIKLIQEIFGLLLIIKSGEMIPGLPMG